MFFKRKQSANVPATAVPQTDLLVAALASFLQSAVTAQSKNIEAIGNFTTNLIELSASQAGRALGRRRTATARRDEKGHMLRTQASCRVCKKDQSASAEEIRFHLSGHRDPRTNDALEKRREAEAAKAS